MPFSARQRRIFWGIVLVAAVIGLALLLQDVLNTLVVALAEYEATRPILGPVLFILLAAASVMLGPFTSAPLMPFAVGVWGTGKTLALLFFGWSVGNTIAYAIGYYFGFPLVRRIVPEEHLRKWMHFLRERVSAWGIFLFRLAAPAEIGYAFGILKYDFRKYLAIVLAAEVPFALVVVYGGDAYIDGRWATLAIIAGGALLLMGGAWLLFRRKS